MPATVVITSFHGAAGATTNNIQGTTIRYKLADNDTNDAVNPVVIPTSGTAYSWMKHFKLNATTTPANTIDNIKVYSDGANGLGTGVDLLVKTNASYTDPITNAGTAVAGTATVFGYTSGSPLAVTGSISNPSTGSFGDYIVSQLSVASTAIQGNTGNETVTLSYDES